MDILDLHEDIKNLKFNGLTLNLDERYIMILSQVFRIQVEMGLLRL